MESICKIYKIGNGPSSSHTIGPRKAALLFKERNAEADHFAVTLYGSLAATGKGHLTDVAIIEAMKPFEIKINFEPGIFQAFHPNAMLLEAFDLQGIKLNDWMVYSVCKKTSK